MTVRVLVAAGLLWVAAILSAPLTITSGRPALSIGSAGVYAAASRVCHQLPDRCFWIHGRPMPVCARCAGLYVSAAFAAPLALVWGSGLSSRRARRLVLIAALPTLATWGIEAAGLAHPSNIVRFAAALPLGFVAAAIVVMAMRQPPARAPDRLPCRTRQPSARIRMV
jgi:uncharacterized membrane protein